MLKGGKLMAKEPLSWKKSFSYGVIIPYKVITCNKCTKDIFCDGCDKLVSQNEEFEGNLIE